jgi:hypothetical protein
MEATLQTIIGDIESAIEARLKTGGLAVNAFSVTEEPETIDTPAANIAFVGGQCSRLTNTTFKVDGAKFQVIVMVQDLRSEKARRLAVYPLVMSVIGLLAGKRLSVLDGETPRVIEARPLTPGRIAKVYESATRMAFSIEFTTSFTITAMDDDEAAMMMTVAIDYFLKAGDDVADARDEVDLDA